jgi:putative ABC transport system ATP-binding protein
MQLKLNNINFRYTEKEVLKNFSLSVESGQMVLFEGPSGSGKSTLLAILAGLLSSQGGEIEWGDTTFSALSENERAMFRREHFAYSHQDSHLIDHWTIEQNLALVGSETARVRDALGALNFHLPLNTRVGRLSGGERQRVSIARALLKPHKVLFLDEPTSHLDDQSTERFFRLLKNTEGNRTVLLVSHDHRLRDQIQTRFLLEELG